MPTRRSTRIGLLFAVWNVVAYSLAGFFTADSMARGARQWRLFALLSLLGSTSIVSTRAQVKALREKKGVRVAIARAKRLALV